MPAVNEFTCCVEVTGVACRLSDHMQEDLAHVVEPPTAEQVLRPPRRCAVQGSGGNDGVGQFYLPPVGVQHRGGPVQGWMERNRRVGSGHDDEVERNSKIIRAARTPIFCVIRSWGRAYLLAAVRSLIRCRPGTSWGTCWR